MKKATKQWGMMIGMMIMSFSSYAVDEIQKVLNNEIEVPTYYNEYGTTQLVITFEYASAKARATDVTPSLLKDVDVLTIDLVYSDFPKGDELHELTEIRIQALIETYPSLEDDLDKIQVIRQTNCKNREEARGLFHGVVINYREKPSLEKMADEVAYIEHMLAAPTTPTPLKIAEEAHPAEINFESEKVLEHSEISESSYDSYLDVVDGSIAVTITVPLVEYPFEMSPYSFSPDTTVAAVLNRKKWDNIMLVADVTGSMSPYMVQFFTWLKLTHNQNKLDQVTFFNDGNNMPDGLKVIGKTGGIYTTDSKSFDDIKSLATEAMMKGCGGDAPENNLEAVLEATKSCKDCENIVMIADNWANLKDYKLLKKIDKPIKVILCGAGFGINAEYLNLARESGGSLHLMEQDLEDLMTMSEGEILEIRGKKFVIKDGKFEALI